ncbi:MAG: enoyl-CoA hydratase/isomerase family protein [Cellvibrionaceae bacterium]
MSNILYSSANGVAIITLNRPEKHNAFDDATLAELKKNLLQAEQDETVRVVILDAKGKSFSAGADLAWMQRMVDYSHDENLQDAQILSTTLKTLNNLSKPTIAKVQGNAYGGALGLISCCDIAIACHHTHFCFSEVKLGLIPATISPYVIHAIGPRAARRYFLTGETFDAATALNLHLIQETAAPDELDSLTQAIANDILQNCPSATALCKKLISDVQDKPIDDQLINDTCQRIASIRTSDTAQERLRDFLNKKG